MKIFTIAAGGAVVLALSAATVTATARGPGGHFSKMDANEDGIVTASEMNARHEALVAAADANGDGGVSEEEMRAYRKAKRDEMRAENNPDTNGDGVIDRAEFQASAEKRFDRLDKNDDGVLSEDEQPRRRGRHHRGGRYHGERSE